MITYHMSSESTLQALPGEGVHAVMQPSITAEFPFFHVFGASPAELVPAAK